MTILFLGGTLLTIGDVFMKKWTIDSKWFFYLFGMVNYLIGLNLLAYSFKSKDMAVASVLIIVFNVATLTVAGYFLFGEYLSLNKIIGMCLAIAAAIFLEIG